MTDPTAPDLTPDEIAQKSAHAMWANDQASAWLGMVLGPVTAGSAELQLTVQAHHCNGLGICHGGVTFALADSTFAFACNSRNQMTVAQNNMITFIAPARQGDTLTATAREVSLTGRSGIYDVRVVTQSGTLVAEMRGLSRAIRGTLF